jgi:Tetratricopeptide repeat
MLLRAKGRWSRSAGALRGAATGLPSAALLFAASLLPAQALAEGPAQSADQAPSEARARELEELGRFAEAARVYEAAFKVERAPALLYRLGLCRRHLGDYAAAREALRGYLREAPDGPLRGEAERQLAQLQVLIEERGLHPEPGHPHKPVPSPASKPAPKPAPARAAPESATLVAPPAPAAAPVAPDAPAPASLGAHAAAPTAAPSQPTAPPPQAITPDPAPSPAPAAVTTTPASAPPAPAPGLKVRPAIPWLVAAGALTIGGGALVWDGSRIASDLDARFAGGDLTAADAPRYDRSRREAIAGRILLGAALVAVGLAVAAAW